MIQVDKNGFAPAESKGPGSAEESATEKVSDAAVQEALASLVAREEKERQERPKPGEIKWKLTTIVYPAVLLVFVALYVTSLSAGSQPEVALFQAGAASVVLAILGRTAVGILGDDSRLVLNDSQIVAMARTGAVRDIIDGAGSERGSDGAGQPPTAAQTAGAGGKE